jgi:hypothetical protein
MRKVIAFKPLSERFPTLSPRERANQLQTSTDFISTSAVRDFLQVGGATFLKTLQQETPSIASNIGAKITSPSNLIAAGIGLKLLSHAPSLKKMGSLAFSRGTNLGFAIMAAPYVYKGAKYLWNESSKFI